MSGRLRRAAGACVLVAVVSAPALVTASADAAGPRGRAIERVESCGLGLDIRIGEGGIHASLGDRRAHVHRHRGPNWRWIDGHWSWRTDRVFVEPAHRHRVWVDAVYGWRTLPCGTRERYLVRSGHWATQHVPARYETRRTRVWIAGHWERVRVDRGRRHGRHARRGR